MKIFDAAFLISVPADGHLPPGLGPTIAMVGRSNVGKSSLINALTRRRIARAGSKPGTTRLVNLYAVRMSMLANGKPVRFTLADLPGYGFARGGLNAKREFDAMANGFFSQMANNTSIPATPDRRRLAGLILVIDGRHPGLKSDLAARAWVRQHDFPITIVTTKNDRMSRNAQVRSTRGHEQALGGMVIAASSKTGHGIQSVWTAIRALL